MTDDVEVEVKVSFQTSCDPDQRSLPVVVVEMVLNREDGSWIYVFSVVEDFKVVSNLPYPIRPSIVPSSIAVSLSRYLDFKPPLTSPSPPSWRRFRLAYPAEEQLSNPPQASTISVRGTM